MVHYEPHGKAWHGWPEDLDGSGSFVEADRNIGIVTPAGKTIGEGAYNVLVDLDFSGDLDSNEIARCEWSSNAAALDAGAISDPDFDSGPWSCAGYDGYIYDEIADLSCVRFRWYNAGLGRWMTRDPIGVRGESVSTYENVLSSPLIRRDHMGLASDSCTNGLCTTSMHVCRPLDPGGLPVVWSITEAPPLPWRTPQDLGTEAPDFDSLGCDDLLWWTSLYLRANGYASLPVVGGELERHFIDGMANELQAFSAWYNSQRCLRWTVGLPPCPCVIDADCPPDKAVWGDVTTTLWGYHVGAHSCMRSRPVNGAANQCCYDEDGQLITHGSGSGSADRFAAVGLDGLLSHKRADMLPADSAMLLDSGS